MTSVHERVPKTQVLAAGPEVHTNLRALVEMIPQLLIVGVIAPTIGIDGGTVVTTEKLNRVWSDVAPRHGYRTLEQAPDGSAAKMRGVSNDDALLIQPPLIQVRDTMIRGAERAAAEAEEILKAVSHHLGAREFFNLGVRHVYHAPAPNRDAISFVLANLLGKTGDEFQDLQIGDSFWVGFKSVSNFNNSTYTLIIDPLVADNDYLYIDLDIQIMEPTNLENIQAKAGDAVNYLQNKVVRHLDSLTPA